MRRVHHRNCHLCEASCGITVEAEGERIVSIRGDAEDPLSKGYVCPKALAIQDLWEDPDRLKRPLLRNGTSWREASWEEALTFAARGLAAARATGGRDAVAMYIGNPTVHNYGALLYGVGLAEFLGTRNRYSATSCDQLPKMLAAYLMYGHQILLSLPDLERARHLLILGANPVASNGSICTAPGWGKRIHAIRERGGRVVVVDPRRTETAAIADAHQFIRPGTDAAFLLALLHVVFAEKLERPGRLAPHMDGLETIREIAGRYPPERVAAATGIAPEATREIAREFARAPRAACYGRVGTTTQEFGGTASWLIEVLNAVTGNLDEPGGMVFARPAVDGVKAATLLGQQGSFDTYRSRVRGLPEFGHELPAVCLAEEIETPGRGQVRALVTLAGNPVLSTPNGARLDRAVATLDHYVAIDFYLNETTRHAHVILPPTFALERDSYDVGFYLVSVRNIAKYSPALFARPESARHDWEICLEIQTRLMALEGGPRRFVSPLVRFLGKKLGPRGIVDLGLRLGRHGDLFGLRPSGLSLKKLERSPHGVDLGAHEPVFPRRLPARRIRLAPEPFVKDLERLESVLRQAQDARGELRLIGRRHLRSNNSWMHNLPRLARKDLCTLLMHPEDARARGLSDGSRVRLVSRVGTVEVPLEVSDEVMPGVVSLPHGWGHDRKGTRLSHAAKQPGASVNDVTDEAFFDALSGTAGFSGVPVRVEA